MPGARVRTAPSPMAASMLSRCGVWANVGSAPSLVGRTWKVTPGTPGSVTGGLPRVTGTTSPQFGSANDGRREAAPDDSPMGQMNVYHVLKEGAPYEELGGDHLERLEPERLTRQLVRRLEQLGHKVSLEAQPA
jgi:hypothetical protein